MRIFCIDSSFTQFPFSCRFELISQPEDEIAFGFNGRGYFKSEPVPFRRPKPYYSVVLAFKTLDEHALLFLATNEEKVK